MSIRMITPFRIKLNYLLQGGDQILQRWSVQFYILEKCFSLIFPFA